LTADFVFDVVGVQDEFLYACLVGEGMITITAYIKSNRPSVFGGSAFFSETDRRRGLAGLKPLIRSSVSA